MVTPGSDNASGSRTLPLSSPFCVCPRVAAGSIIATRPAKAATQSILLRMMTSLININGKETLSYHLEKEIGRSLNPPGPGERLASVEVLDQRPLTRGHPTGSELTPTSGSVISCLETPNDGDARNPRRESPFGDSIRGLGSLFIGKRRQAAGLSSVTGEARSLQPGQPVPTRTRTFVCI